MKLDDFTGKPCRTKTAFEFLPKRTTKLNLELVTDQLAATCESEVKSKVLLIVKCENRTVSIFPSGKILVRGEKDEKRAREIAEKVVSKINEY
ncbi:MAG: hypothetical protein AABW59_05610 [archaeon]